MAPYQANTHRYQAVSWRRETTLILTAAKLQHCHCGARISLMIITWPLHGNFMLSNGHDGHLSFVKIGRTGGKNIHYNINIIIFIYSEQYSRFRFHFDHFDFDHFDKCRACSRSAIDAGIIALA
jgi:hypothetical protein